MTTDQPTGNETYLTEDDMNQFDIALYTSDFCPRCSQVKEALRDIIDTGFIRTVSIDDTEIDPALNIDIVPALRVNGNVADLNAGVTDTGYFVAIIAESVGTISFDFERVDNDDETDDDEVQLSIRLIE